MEDEEEEVEVEMQQGEAELKEQEAQIGQKSGESNERTEQQVTMATEGDGKGGKEGAAEAQQSAFIGLGGAAEVTKEDEQELGGWKDADSEAAASEKAEASEKGKKFNGQMQKL